jgi:hypothetical protein
VGDLVSLGVASEEVLGLTRCKLSGSDVLLDEFDLTIYLIESIEESLEVEVQF